MAVATHSGQVAATNIAMVFNSEINLAPELPFYSGFNNELLIKRVAHPFLPQQVPSLMAVIAETLHSALASGAKRNNG